MSAGPGARASALGFGLYLVTDRAAVPRPLVDVVDECLDAGLRAVQLREKDLAVGALLDLRPIPERAVLLVQQDEFAIGRRPRGAA